MWKVWDGKVQDNTVGLREHERNTREQQNADATSGHEAAQTISEATQTTLRSQDVFPVFLKTQTYTLHVLYLCTLQ